MGREQRLMAADSGVNLCHLASPPVVNKVPVLVVAAVFGSFTFLVVVVSVCCLIGILFSE